MAQELSEQDRRKLLNRRNGALTEYERLMNGLGSTPPLSDEEANGLAKARAAMARAEAAEAEYFDALPVIAVSNCPFCSKPLLRSFDRWGFDGPWWRSDAAPEDPADCPHFYALLGAVRLSESSEPVPREAYLGPGAPFIVPRLLALPSSLAVVGQLEMQNGCTVWPIAYFAERRPRPEDSTAGWRRTNFVYTTQFSISGWRIPNEVLDFDVQPWVERGKVRGCGPDLAFAFEAWESGALTVLTPSGVVRYSAPRQGPVWPISVG